MTTKPSPSRIVETVYSLLRRTDIPTRGVNAELANGALFAWVLFRKDTDANVFAAHVIQEGAPMAVFRGDDESRLFYVGDADAIFAAHPNTFRLD